MRTGLLLVIAAVSALQSSASAQLFKTPLETITAIQLSVELSTDDAAPCGLDKQIIEQAVMFPISGSQIVVATGKTTDAPTLQVTVVTLRTNQGLCFSSVSLRLMDFDLYSKAGAPDAILFGTILLWSDHVAGYAVQHLHAQQMRNAIENSTKRFITTWNLANKPLPAVSAPAPARSKVKN